MTGCSDVLAIKVASPRTKRALDRSGRQTRSPGYERKRFVCDMIVD